MTPKALLEVPTPGLLVLIDFLCCGNNTLCLYSWENLWLPKRRPLGKWGIAVPRASSYLFVWLYHVLFGPWDPVS